MKENYVQIDKVKSALEEAHLNEEQINEIIAALNNSTIEVDVISKQETVDPEPEVETLEEPKDEKPPSVKQQWVILVSDPNKTITEELVGWVLQIPEDDDYQQVVEELKKAGYDFNTTKSGIKYPVNSIGSIINVVPPKILKKYNLKVKTKEPLYVLTTDNDLPKE